MVKGSGSLVNLEQPTCRQNPRLCPRNNFEQKRYYSKCNGYKKVGFKITEQEKKFTGFESVKEFLKNETGNGWEFEHRYRHPLEKQFEFFGTPSKFVFEPFVENFLNNMYQDKHAAL